MVKQLMYAVLAAGVLAGSVAVAPLAGAAEVPQLTSVSFPTAEQNVTYTAGSLTVTVAARNTDEVQLTARVLSGGTLYGPEILELPPMRRIAGDVASGTYSATLALGGGSRSTWQISLFLVRRFADGTSATQSWDPAQLTAAGFPAQVRTTTAAGVVPPTPRNLRVRSEWFVGGTSVYQRWVASWAQSPGGQPLAAQWLVGATGKCRPQTGYIIVNLVGYGAHEGGTGSCTVTVRAANANGASAAVSGSTFFIG